MWVASRGLEFNCRERIASMNIHHLITVFIVVSFRSMFTKVFASNFCYFPDNWHLSIGWNAAIHSEGKHIFPVDFKKRVTHSGILNFSTRAKTKRCFIYEGIRMCICIFWKWMLTVNIGFGADLSSQRVVKNGSLQWKKPWAPIFQRR